MDKPQIPDAPGLAWRPRKNAWAAVWLARQDIAKRGFEPATHQILVLTAPPTEAQEMDIRAVCVRLQEEMYAFGAPRPAIFGGRVRDLINIYETHPKSTYRTARPGTRKGYNSHIRKINSAIGGKLLADLGADEITDLYDAIRWPDGRDNPEGREHVSMAHGTLTQLRMMLTFGAVFEVEKARRDQVSECRRLRDILTMLKFENGKGRDEAMTLRQCEDIIAAAELPSIALAQAFQFDLRLRQRDAIGEWVKDREPGITDVTRPGYKWLRGLRHEEISSTMLLEHKMSKSNKGKIIKADLNNHPMILAELAKIPPEKRFGPIVVCELTGRPWTQSNFRRHWREAAKKAGVPASVWNMDSRPGGITETIEATNGNIEAARKQAGHSDIRTTQKYSRRQLESNSDTAARVLDFRTKNAS